MRIVERRVLRGPNVHSRRPVYLAVIDLEDLDGVSSAALPGFVDALLAAVPTLQQHRCSPGHVGGFVERLRDGTFMAHVVEHVAIELQCLAGHEVGFGRARKVKEQLRQYRVVFAYRAERVAAAALDLAIDLVTDLVADRTTGRPGVLDDGLAQLRVLAGQAAIGPSTRAIVDAAKRRGIPTMRLCEPGNLFQLGWGVKQQRIQATMTSRTNHVSVGMASDKELTKRTLKEAGLPVPRGRVVTTLAEAVAAARAARGNVAIKPLDGNQGKGVTTSLRGDDAVASAFARALQFSRRVIVEDHIDGDDYRALVVGGALVAASRRVPPEVVGDGRSSVRALVDAVNADPRRGDGHENALTKIRLDETATHVLAKQGLDVDAVPEAGRMVRLRGNANLSTGGTAQDVTDDVHPDTALACVRAARKIGLDVAGIDLVCSDIRRPLAAQGGAIIEVNAAPGIRMHEHPSSGERRYVGRAIVDSLFSADDDGRIPVVSVTGSNGKTTTALFIAHVMQRMGRVTGVATTEGVSIGGRRVIDGDCTGYWSARTLLTAPEVEFAVLETARGGILKRGLAFDRCDVGVVLNVHADHLGLDGVDTLQDLARVKGLVVATARKAAVLNADDVLCVALAGRALPHTEIIYFGFDAATPAMAAHLAGGGRAVHESAGMLVWANGGHAVPLVASAQLPSTLGGRARHNIANAMATFAALLALDVPPEHIAAALSTFSSDESQNPMRLNVYRTNGVTLMVDYAHNAAAYRAIIATGRQMTSGRLIGAVAAPGDRRDADLTEIGQVCGSGFDGLIVFEMDDRRGQPAGATAALLAAGAGAAREASRTGPCAGSASGDRSCSLSIVLDVRAAIREALDWAVPGDLVIVGCASHVDELQDALGVVGLSSLVPAAADDLDAPIRNTNPATQLEDESQPQWKAPEKRDIIVV